MTTVLTEKKVIRFIKNSINKNDKLIKRIEDSIKRTDAIMYGKPVKQKLDSEIQATLSDRISKIIKPVCKAVAKIIRTPSHHEDLLKPKPHK